MKTTPDMIPIIYKYPEIVLPWSIPMLERMDNNEAAPIESEDINLIIFSENECRSSSRQAHLGHSYSILLLNEFGLMIFIFGPHKENDTLHAGQRSFSIKPRFLLAQPYMA